VLTIIEIAAWRVLGSIGIVESDPAAARVQYTAPL
jgi:hypothetical protein